MAPERPIRAFRLGLLENEFRFLAEAMVCGGDTRQSLVDLVDPLSARYATLCPPLGQAQAQERLRGELNDLLRELSDEALHDQFVDTWEAIGEGDEGALGDLRAHADHLHERLDTVWSTSLREHQPQEQFAFRLGQLADRGLRPPRLYRQARFVWTCPELSGHEAFFGGGPPAVVRLMLGPYSPGVHEPGDAWRVEVEAVWTDLRIRTPLPPWGRPPGGANPAEFRRGMFEQLVQAAEDGLLRVVSPDVIPAPTFSERISILDADAGLVMLDKRKVQVERKIPFRMLKHLIEAGGAPLSTRQLNECDKSSRNYARDKAYLNGLFGQDLIVGEAGVGYKIVLPPFEADR